MQQSANYLQTDVEVGKQWTRNETERPSISHNYNSI
jgi:hypothetical protein